MKEVATLALIFGSDLRGAMQAILPTSILDPHF
jgi:hypothetical protein